MRTPAKPRDQIQFENERDTAARHASGYVTERERRFLKTIDDRRAAGFMVTPAQQAMCDNIRAVLGQ